jgi:alpha-tubulin suppressor-like RCC1 family protein
MIKKISFPMLVLCAIFVFMLALSLINFFNLNKKTSTTALTDAKGVSAGGGYTCAVTKSGAVKCWGMNDKGQLGDGTTTYRSTATDVIGLYSGVATVSAGGDHTCAVLEDGRVKCWGNNLFGQLGDGTTVQRNAPVDVIELNSKVATVSAGNDHTCALTTTGGVKCWGLNEHGQLGDGTTIDRHTPVDVLNMSDSIRAIAINFLRNCALTTSGGVKCWGDNGFWGQRWEPTRIARSTPVEISYLSSGIKAIAAGVAYNCALTTDGKVKCWEDHQQGECQLEDGTPVDCATPWEVTGLSHEVTAIAVSSRYLCFLLKVGEVQCMGNNGSGQLGDGTTTDRDTPVYVIGLSGDVTAITVGNEHTCVLTAADEVKCWGYNSYGRLGDGTNINRSHP